MLFLLAPSKTMDVTPMSPLVDATTPIFHDEARQIVDVIKRERDIVSLMKVSQSIARTVTEMYDTWGEVTKSSAYLYRGDVYKGFYANTLRKDDLLWAQDHLMIISGLYGLVRPLDEISRYRLEMKAPIAVSGTKNLYEFWGDSLAQFADKNANGIICLLTSEEYARPIRRYSTSQLITPVFMDYKPNGTVGPVPIYSKMMRGVMARWVIDTRAETLDDLRQFMNFDYHYDDERSSANELVFVRKKMTPLVF